MKGCRIFWTGVLFGLWLFAGQAVRAEEIEGNYVLSDGQELVQLTDGDYSTGYKFKEEDVLTITPAGDREIRGVYVLWDSPVKPWELETSEGKISCGENGFLHEYVPLENGYSELKLHMPEGGARICEIHIFEEGELPDWVQVWQPPCEKADIIMVSSHADDEILFFGGIIPTYYVGQGAKVQVIYMTEYWTGQKVREHEKLDGLWASGLDIYPVCGNFKDVYSENLEQAMKQYDTEAMVDYLVEQFRRFRPQVVVSHDIDGEYGHGFHMLTSKVVRDAVEAAPLAEHHEASVQTYGTWDVPKTYLHLYEENEIFLDLRSPIEGMDGRTALEVATEAYKQHKSQQWCWFYVSDDYKYSCARFGLYRTTVGEDTGDDMLENIVTYQEQERQEAERLEQESQEAERLKQERLEAERLEAERQEAERLEQERLEAERLEAERQEAQRLEAERLQQEKERRNRVILYSGCALFFVAGGIVGGVLLRRKNKCL
ncbi:MAG: PIG-L family deacetylase [Lachnospiraceae bacterium]|nr:PIG-L family deacetylase [Lachnospiraceae bacterium]